MCQLLLEDQSAVSLPPSLLHPSLPEWVQHSFARRPAHDGVKRERLVGLEALLERRVQAANGHHHAGGLEPRRRPRIPRHADTIPLLNLREGEEWGGWVGGDVNGLVVV